MLKEGLCDHGHQRMELKTRHERPSKWSRPGSFLELLMSLLADQRALTVAANVLRPASAGRFAR